MSLCKAKNHKNIVYIMYIRMELTLLNSNPENQYYLFLSFYR